MVLVWERDNNNPKLEGEGAKGTAATLPSFPGGNRENTTYAGTNTEP